MARILDHKPDGIEEEDNPLPAWWLYGFFGTIAWAAVYAVLYPTFWFWHGAVDWDEHLQYKAQIAEAQVRYAEVAQEAPGAKVLKRVADPSSLVAGKGIFAKNCAVCHGENATGKIGPNLTDGDWLYGGTPDDIVTTITNGRPRGMPAWKKVLGKDNVLTVAAYVYSLSHKEAASR